MERKQTQDLPAIGFDAKRAAYNGTGLGNYSRFVIEGLAEAMEAGPTDGNAPLYLVAARKKNKPLSAAYQRLLERYPQRLIPLAPKGFTAKRLPSLWRRYGMGRTLTHAGIGLYHGLSNELPVGLAQRGIRSVVTIHDLIFLVCPQYYKPIDRLIYTIKAKHACKRADRILAVSECTKRDIVRYFGTAPDKIDVIYQGCEPKYAENPGPSATTAVRRRYGLPEAFLLFVGSIEERKNLGIVVEALAGLRETHPALHLVAVGKRTPYTARVEARAAALGLQDRLHCLHGVSDQDLRALYHAARIFVYPSRYEGFGIPSVEAIHAGLPVIAATGSCLEEAGGPACRYISPDDAPAWAEAIAGLLSNADTRARIVTEAQAYVRRFDRAAVTQQLITLYKSL